MRTSCRTDTRLYLSFQISTKPFNHLFYACTPLVPPCNLSLAQALYGAMVRMVPSPLIVQTGLSNPSTIHFPILCFDIPPLPEEAKLPPRDEREDLFASDNVFWEDLF